MKEWDLFEARRLRDDGMRRALAHAEVVEPRWGDVAYQALRDYIASHRGLDFMADDVRRQADDVPPPPDKRAWGPVFVRAVKAGLIRRVGYAPIKDKKSHCCPQTVWRGL